MASVKSFYLPFCTPTCLWNVLFCWALIFIVTILSSVFNETVIVRFLLRKPLINMIRFTQTDQLPNNHVLVTFYHYDVAHLVNVITLPRCKSDHIKRLQLYISKPYLTVLMSWGIKVFCFLVIIQETDLFKNYSCYGTIP